MCKQLKSNRNACCFFFPFSVNGNTGVLWDPEGAGRQLAVQDLCAWCSAQVFAVSQEGWRHEADPEWHQVGPC